MTTGFIMLCVACSDEYRAPAIGPLRVMGSLLQPRSSFAAAQLPDGRILVVGGQLEDGTALATAEIVDAAAGTVRPVSCTLGIARKRPVAVTMLDGRIMVLGGDTGNLYMILETEIYDPATDCFLNGPPMVERRATVGSALRLQDGRILVVKGWPLTHEDTSGGAEVYDPQNGAWAVLNRDLGRETEVGGVSLLSDGRVLLVGGDEVVPLNTGVPSRRVVVFDPATNAFSELEGGLSQARDFMVVVSDDNGGAFVIGGGTGLATDLVEYFDARSNRVTVAGRLVVPRLNSSGLLIDRWVLVLGGKSQFGAPALGTSEWIRFDGAPGGAGPSLERGVAMGHYSYSLGDGRVVVLRAAGDPPDSWASEVLVSQRR